MSKTSRSVTPHARGLLGLRVTPGRLALWVFRLPLGLYRRGWGRLLGHVFLHLVHVGRRSGQPHSTIAMVLAYDPASRRAVICSGWGPDADWVRNLRAGPAARVDIGGETFTPSHRFLTDDEAVAVVQEFRRRHPSRVRLITRILAWDLGSDEAVRAFVAARPFVELTPSTGSNAPAR